MRDGWIPLEQVAVPPYFARRLAALDDGALLCERWEPEEAVGRVARRGDVRVDLKSRRRPTNLLGR